MSARMQFPLSQRRHTNIAVVRYTKNGIKLEIACYKNKVVSYRGGTEDRMDEVLQVERVFTNVARGHVASEKDIHAVFGNNMSEEEAIIFILKHGELQVAQQERTAEVDELFKDIAMIISQKCINTETQRPFPVQVVETALRSVGAAVKLDQPVKKQALALIHQLIESNVIPISRANMKLRCVVPNAAVLREVEVWCVEHGADAQPNNNNSDDDQQALLICMQPHLFRELEAFVRADLPAGCQLHTLETAVMEVESSSPVSGSTINLMSEDARSLAKSKASKTSTKNTNNNNMAEEMDDEEDDEKGGKRGKKGANNRRKQPQDLAAALQVSDDDDDDDGKRKKGGRKAKQAKKAVAAPTKPAEPEEVDSDEELAGNRRQRKKQVAPAHEQQNDDEENFDYGEED